MIMLLKPYREAIKDVIGLKYVRERISGLNSNNPHDNRSSFALVAPKTQVQMVKPMNGNHQLDQWATRRKSVFVMTQL
uniref:Uncharacterized protein n=1 Tax=Acrobeloides nanus TaxID=290746 RepID=A0A914DWJ4_9BILA